MVIDTSVIVAIAKREPDYERFVHAIATAQHRGFPASCYLEAAMVLSRQRDGRRLLDLLVQDADMTILSIDPRQARLAADAFERFGRGSGHLAKLNFGDCLAYAAAKSLDAPLLFKGDDFARTDVRPALAPA